MNYDIDYNDLKSLYIATGVSKTTSFGRFTFDTRMAYKKQYEEGNDITFQTYVEQSILKINV